VSNTIDDSGCVAERYAAALTEGRGKAGTPNTERAMDTTNAGQKTGFEQLGNPFYPLSEFTPTHLLKPLPGCGGAGTNVQIVSDDGLLALVVRPCNAFWEPVRYTRCVERSANLLPLSA
jgi:hypothetical protein